MLRTLMAVSLTFLLTACPQNETDTDSTNSNGSNGATPTPTPGLGDVAFDGSQFAAANGLSTASGAPTPSAVVAP